MCTNIFRIVFSFDFPNEVEAVEIDRIIQPFIKNPKSVRTVHADLFDALCKNALIETRDLPRHNRTQNQSETKQY